MRNNELLTTPAIADTAETNTEPQSALPDNVTVYKFGRSVYKVHTYFNLECKETLEDVVNRLIMRDLAKETM